MGLTQELKAQVALLKESKCDAIKRWVNAESELSKCRNELNDLRGEIACATDCGNTWARENSVIECLDPYSGNSLRDLIDRLCSRLSQRRHDDAIGRKES